MSQREHVQQAVSDVVALLQTEFSALAPEFRVRADELKEAALTNANALLDGSITLAQAEENIELLSAALQSELLVAGYRAKAKVASITTDSVAILFRLAFGLLGVG